MNDPSSISGNTKKSRRHPDQLLQYLFALQEEYNHIPETAIIQLSESLSVSAAHIRGVVDFYSFLNTKYRGQFDVRFSNNITDRMAGSQDLMAALCDKLGVEPGISRSDQRVTVDTTSCTGMCDQGPALLINGLPVTRLDPQRITHIAELIEAGRLLGTWPREYFSVDDNIHLKGSLLSDSTPPGKALKALFESGEQSALSSLIASGLQGRGGAGFPTGKKWAACRETEASQHFVVCNADEGEPGTFKDRVLLTRHAERLLEGMAICAHIIGAELGLIYLRAEYFYLYPTLEQAIQKFRDQGLLGEGILGQAGFDFDIVIHMGAGAYICGEESALIESLEGKRGHPRTRPPFPVSQGYMKQPTVVNNVETFIAATSVIAHGEQWFRKNGTEHSSGTKIISISGDCTHPGIYEFPYGTSIQAILDSCGADNTQAVQISGAAGQTIKPEEFQRILAFEDINCGGSFMIFGEQRDMLDMVLNFSHFFSHECCGFCTPCRVGTSLLEDLVEKVYQGQASEYDLEEIRNISAVMRNTSHCGLGKTATNPVMDMLEKFPETYKKRLSHPGFEPAFDLDAAVQEARDLTGRDDPAAHIRSTR